jgi:hypothetical protein
LVPHGAGMWPVAEESRRLGVQRQKRPPGAGTPPELLAPDGLAPDG